MKQKKIIGIEIYATISKLGTIVFMETLMKLKKRSWKESLDLAYWNYRKTGRLKEFLENTSSCITVFIKRNLTGDEDICADFYLHFYENAEKMLLKYDERNTAPFSSFLMRFLKNEFMNFIRKKRNQNVIEITGMESFLETMPAHSSIRNIEDRLCIESLLQEISRLPIKFRLPLKMHYGLDLNLKELDFLANLMGDPPETRDLLQKYRLKKEKIHSRQIALGNRAARLHYMTIRGRDSNLQIERWMHLKKRIEDHLKRCSSILTVQELADIFGLNKSTMARRLKFAIASLKHREEEVMRNNEHIKQYLF